MGLCGLLAWSAVAHVVVFGQQPSFPPSHTGAVDRTFQAAVAAYKAGNLVEAASRLEAFLPRVPRSFEAHELLGLVYGAQGQNEKAVEQFRTAVQIEPAFAAARSNLASGLMHLGRVAEARLECVKAIALDPKDYEANRDLAGLYLQQGKVLEALPLLETARHVRPGAYDNGYDLALAYLLLGRLSEARILVGELLRQKDSGELHNLLGRISEKEGKYLEAADEFSNSAHMDPSEDNLFIWASELLLHRTYVPAIEVFRNGSQRYPESPRLLIGLGMALYARGEYEESIRSLIAAADLNPRDARCYLFLSKAFLSSPHQAEAVIERFRRYAQLEPRNALAQYYYAMGIWKGRRLETQDVEYETIASLLQKSIALDDANAEVHLQLGILYTDERAFERAFPEYQRAVQLSPDSSDAHFRLGRYYLHAGDKEKAEVELALFKKLQAQHQAQEDKARAEVRQFVVAGSAASVAQP